MHSSYLIDEEGVIQAAFGKVKPAENAKQMFELLRLIGEAANDKIYGKLF